MSIKEKIEVLTNEQKQELNTLTTPEEVSAFAAKHNFDLTPEEAAKIAASLPDEMLVDVSGGSRIMPRPPAPTVLL